MWIRHFVFISWIRRNDRSICWGWRMPLWDTRQTCPCSRDVNLKLAAGDRIGLLGVNGAGKSTLVKALASGATLLSGQRVLAKDTRIGYFAQHQLDQLEPAQSPMDHLRGYAAKESEVELRKYLGSFGFSGERIFEPIAPFSGGEKARLVLALLIRQQPNLLLMDEPTNHLDLEMRQALSVALIEYSGALVVISHDRHLLRSVCDELLIVHDGIVDRFTESLDGYPDWLKAHQARDAPAVPLDVDDSPRQTSKKQLRQQEAERRRRLKPLLDAVRDVELRLEKARSRLEVVEKSLGDGDLYALPQRKAELPGLLKEQAALTSAIDQLESDWLQASELLDEKVD